MPPGGDEHPLLVYAANGFIVLNTAFPLPQNQYLNGGGTRGSVARGYDPNRNFPHITMYMESTFRALDAAAEIANIDRRRVGIGGVSHGAFIPLFMLQNSDRLAALSVGGGGWSPLEYYFSRFPGIENENPSEAAWPEDPFFWSRIDLADHVDEVEAPILFHFAGRELIGGGRLLRRLRNARLPIEAYAFPEELHAKYQPAHRLTIYNRNLDWFRFWLQDIEDPDPLKAEQYARWRQLRALQCRNPRSLRDNCQVSSTAMPVAR